jgi:hypothetical protein
MGSSFPIDRCELADRADLGLAEAQVRGAIRALEEVGFLDRALMGSGSKHRLTGSGELHRKPILFVFGPEYAPAFLAANRRARKAARGDLTARRPIASAAPSRPPTGLLEARRTNSPKSKSEAKPQVIMGETTKGIGLPAEPSAPTALELALQRLGEGVFGKPRGG